jgi:hypothetical protein
VSARPRGFITECCPRTETLALIDQMGRCSMSTATLPLALRQIFYRLVGAYFYEKTQRAYERLGEALNKARRARLIDMDVIRDDGFVSETVRFYDGGQGFLTMMADWAAEFRLDRQRDQKRRLVLLSESAGMVSQLARVARAFGIEVYSGGSFDSVTEKHRLGRLWAKSDPPITVLHVGDYDPSGLSPFGNLKADITAFAAAYGKDDIEFIRVAVTEEQAKSYVLPSAPPKPTAGSRGNETWQAEALDPRTLADIVRSAIEERIDSGIVEAVFVEEEKARQAVLSRLRFGESAQ